MTEKTTSECSGIDYDPMDSLAVKISDFLVGYDMKTCLGALSQLIAVGVADYLELDGDAKTDLLNSLFSFITSRVESLLAKREAIQ